MQIPVLQTTTEILEYCWANRRAIRRFSAIPIFLDLGVVLAALALGADLEASDSPAVFLVSVVGLLVYLPLTVTWYRLIVLGPEDAAARPLFTLGRLEGRLFVWQIIIVLILIPVGFAGLTVIVAGLSLISSSTGAFGVALTSIATTAYVLAWCAVSMRLSIVLAMAATDRPVSLSEAWARTNGMGLPMVLITAMLMLATVALMIPVAVLIAIPSAILFVVAQSPQETAEGIFVLITLRLFGVVVLILGATLIAFVYNKIAEAMVGAGAGVSAGTTSASSQPQPNDIAIESDSRGSEQPSSEQEVNAVLESLGAYMADKPKETPDDMRAMFDGLFGDVPLPEGVTTEDIEINNVPARWVSSGGADPDKVVLLFHGGGFVTGSLISYQRLAADVSAFCGVRVLLLDYRLAPEHPYPAGLDDCIDAYRWLLENGYKPGHIALLGDSAGGGLVISTALRLKEKGIDQPAALVALSPWVNLACDGETMETKAKEDPITTREALLPMAGLYLNGVDAKDPLVSPIYGDLRGLPPLLIQVGMREVLLDDSRKLAVRARADEVPVMLEQWPGMFHVWHLWADSLADGRRALGGVGAFIRKTMG